MKRTEKIKALERAFESKSIDPVERLKAKELEPIECTYLLNSGMVIITKVNGSASYLKEYLGKEITHAEFEKLCPGYNRKVRINLGKGIKP